MERKRILCFGDSNTWGFNGETWARYPEEIRWTGRLQKLLGEDYRIVEEGHCGRTTVWDDPAENRLAGLTYLWPCLDSHSPLDLVIIMLGTNDLKHYFNVSAVTIAESAGRLVEMVQKSSFGPCGKAPQVLLVAPIGVEDKETFAHLFGQPAVEKARNFPQTFKTVAERFQCHFFDASSVAVPAPADGIHMDEEGHHRLAEALCQEVKRILQR